MWLLLFDAWAKSPQLRYCPWPTYVHSEKYAGVDPSPPLLVAYMPTSVPITTNDVGTFPYAPCQEDKRTSESVAHVRREPVPERLHLRIRICRASSEAIMREIECFDLQV